LAIEERIDGRGLALVLVLVRVVVLIGVVVLVRRLIEIALGHAAERLALILGHALQHPLVDGIGHEQDVVALGAHGLEVRAVAQRRLVGPGDVPDRSLLGRHAST
jgi:hypothetical protein